MTSTKPIKSLFSCLKKFSNRNALKILSESWNMLLTRPPCFISERAEIKEDCFQFCKKLNNLLLEEKNHLVFVIGEWGSGKTTHIRHFESQFCHQYDFAEKSFFSIRNLHEGFLNLLSIYSKICSVVIILLLAIIAYAKYGWWIGFPTATIFIAHIFITNIWKFYYIIISLFESFILKNKSRVYIIEDLDRSSLHSNDQWALLSSLRHTNFKYIIPYGFDSEDEKIDIIRIAQKLEAKTIELPLDYKVNFRIVQGHEPDFPFSESKWLEIFTPREIIHVVDNTRRISQGHKSLYKQAFIIHCFYKEMLTRLKVDKEHIHHIKFRFETPYARLSGGFSDRKIPPTTLDYFRNMGDSIKHDFIENYRNLFLPKAQPPTSNWFDFELNKLLTLPNESQLLNQLDR